MVHTAAHVVTQRRAHGIEALWIMQLENDNTSLSVDADANECAKVGASVLAIAAQRNM